MIPSREVAQAVDVAFRLKENPWPSDFITEVGLKACGLAPIEGFQIAFVANPSMTAFLPAREVALEVASYPLGCPKVVKSATCLYVRSVFIYLLLY